MTSKYIALTDLKEYIKTTSVSEDSLLERMILAAEAYLDDRCSMTFTESTGTRYYRPDDLKPLPDMGGKTTPAYSWDKWNGTASPTSRNVLWLGKDCLSIQSLTNGDGSTMSSTGYWLEPRNDKPYQYVRLKTSESWLFDPDGEVTITGTWGYSTSAPAHVQQAVLRIAAFWYAARSAQTFDVTAIPELGQITIPKGMVADVDRILKDCGLIEEVRFA